MNSTLLSSCLIVVHTYIYHERPITVGKPSPPPVPNTRVLGTSSSSMCRRPGGEPFSAILMYGTHSLSLSYTDRAVLPLSCSSLPLLCPAFAPRAPPMCAASWPRGSRNPWSSRTPTLDHSRRPPPHTSSWPRYWNLPHYPSQAPMLQPVKPRGEGGGEYANPRQP